MHSIIETKNPINAMFFRVFLLPIIHLKPKKTKKGLIRGQ